MQSCGRTFSKFFRANRQEDFEPACTLQALEPIVGKSRTSVTAQQGNLLPTICPNPRNAAALKVRERAGLAQWSRGEIGPLIVRGMNCIVLDEALA